MSNIETLINAVAAYLAGEFPSVAVKATLYGDLRLEEMKEQPHVFVYPANPYAASLEKTRGYRGAGYTVTVDVVRYLDSTEPDINVPISESLELADQIEAALYDEIMADIYSMADFTTGTAGRNVYEVENLSSQNVFHAVIDVTYLGEVA